MNLDNRCISEERDRDYYLAMQRWPQARAEEFRQLFRHHPLVGAEHLLDVPAGCGSLRRFCPPGTVVQQLEFSAGFGSGLPLVDPCGPWPVQPVDRVVSLAALHHIADLDGFLAQLVLVVRPGGLVHLADVGTGSPIAAFLDDFVGAWTPGGHRGYYRDWSSTAWPAALEPLRVEERSCPWRFSSLTEMESFTRQLFGLRGEPPGLLLEALRERVGWREYVDGVELSWRLSAVDLRRLPAS